ncbi:hypothetical protein AAFO90_15580 [Phaeobacter sp. CAU 1743]|uniref:hypothetical protein n=1 Tax=Phaeobacter sp. CAU 1743 TaxID=3140367 RepID=UPI00325BCA32
MAKSKSAEKVGNPRKTKAAKAQADREAVVVLPMHRSGSSALSRVLNLLGCDLPKTLMLGNETNPTGHWESVEIRALNDDILASGGSQWQDWQAFNPNWYKTPKPHEFQARALKVLQDEFGSSSLFVFKDPRVCRIFPFWRDTFTAAGIDPKIILTVRHPQEVAASLERRKDNGIPVLVGLLLWLRHMLEAEADTRGMTRATVSFDRLLQDPIGIAENLQDELGLFWPSLSELQADVIRGYMDPSLRHHNAAAEVELARAPEFREWLEEVYEIFLRWSREGENSADYPALDTVRARLNDLVGPLHQVVGIVTSQASELTRQMAEIGSLSEAKRATDEKLTEAVNDLQDKLQTLSSALEQRNQEAEETKAALAATQAQLTEARAVGDDLRLEKDRLVGELATRNEAADDLQDKLQTLSSALEQRNQEAEETTAALAATQAQLTEARAASDDVRLENTRLAGELAARDQVIDDLQGKLHTLSSALEQRSHEAEETAAALTAAQGQIREQEQAADALQEALAKAQDAGRADASRISGLQTELETVRQTLKDRDGAVTKLREKNGRLDAEAAAQADDMAQMAQMILEKEEVLKRRNAEAHKAEAEVTALRQDLERIGQELEVRSHALAAAEGEREALLRSTSWKLTAPLRRLSMMLKR